MTKIFEIEKSILTLSHEEFRELTDRLIEQREAAWDVQIEADAAAGRLDALWAESETEIEAGDTGSLDAFLDNERL